MKAHKVQSSGSSVDMTQLIPEGKYTGIIYDIIDLWTQTTESKQYGKQVKRQVHIARELPKVMHEFKEWDWEKPAVVSQRYTLSTFQNSHLRKLIETIAWKMTDAEAEEFELDDLLWKYCKLKLYHNDKYVNIQEITWLDAEETAEEVKKWFKPFNDKRIFDLDSPDKDTYESLPERFKNKIAETPEFWEWDISLDEIFAEEWKEIE